MRHPSVSVDIDRDLEKAMAAGTLVDVVVDRAGGFEQFQDHGKRVRGVLKPIAACVALIAEAGAEGVGVSLPVSPNVCICL